MARTTADVKQELERLCRALAEASPMPLAAVEGRNYTVRYVNPAFRLLVGKPKKELIGEVFSEILRVGEEFLTLLERVYDTGLSEIYTGKEYRASDPALWSFVMWPVLGAGGRPLGIAIQVTEAQPVHEQAVEMNRQQELADAAEKLNALLVQETIEHKRTAALAESQKEALELLAAGAPLVQTLEFLAHAIESDSRQKPIVAIHLLDESRKCFAQIASPSLPSEYRRFMEGVEVNSVVGPCRAAAFHGQRIVVSDLATDQEFKEFASFALPLGVRAACSTPILSSSGKILGTVATYYTEVRDPSAKDDCLDEGVARIAGIIIERKQAEEALRQSEKRYHALFDLIPVGVYSCDASGEIREYNKKAAELWGRKPEPGDTDKRYFRSFKVYRPDGSSIPRERSPMDDVLNGTISNAFDAEGHIKRPDGSRVIVIVDIVGLKDEQGRVTGAISCFDDVTERRRVGQARATLAAIVDSSDDAIISKSLDGIITSWNRGAERLLGFTAKEAIGQPITIAIPSDQPDEEPHILASIRRGEHIDHFETVRLHKDGRLVPVSLTVSPIVNEHGQIVGASTIARDITERNRVEQERRAFEKGERALAVATALRETEAELARVARALTVGELATSIAHEVNQPLAAIVTNAEAGLRWLRARSPKFQEAQESLELIVRDGNRASGVIRRIREFLKKDSRIAPVDLNEVAQEALALVRGDLLKKKITPVIELCDVLPPVRGDRIQLQQVILNLIMNGSDAICAAPDGARELAVVSLASGTNVLVAVRDSGIGMDAGDIGRMFDAFFSTKPTGMGMGLSISRSIIEAHGGRIWAASNNGPGLTVQFTLPTETENL